MATRENPVVTACLRALQQLGAPAMRNNSRTVTMPGRGGRPRPVFFGAPGWPDIVAVLPDGRFLGVECKAPTLDLGHKKLQAGTLADLQIAVHRQLIASRALILTVTSCEEMLDKLRTNGYLK